MKFKKVFFLWLFLAIVFSCAKTNAMMIKMQSRYLGFRNSSLQVYTEIYMPYSKEIEKFLKESIKHGDKLERDPDVVIVIDNINYYGSELNNDDEKNLLDVYNKVLKEKQYILMCENSNSIGQISFMADINKFAKIAKDINSSTLNEICWVANNYYDALKKLFEFEINSCKLDIVWNII